MLGLRLTLVVGMLGFLPVIATAQPTPSTPVRSVPEPATITLLASGVGLGVVKFLRGRKKNKK